MRRRVPFRGAALHRGVYEYDPTAGAWTKVCLDDTACASSAPVVAAVPSSPSAVYAFGRSIVLTDAGTFEWDPAAKVLKTFGSTPTYKRTSTALNLNPDHNHIISYSNNTPTTKT